MGEDQARVLRRALRKTLREEERFLSRKEERPAWKEAVEGKVPEQLRATLDLAFQKAFRLVFLQGSGLIDRTIPEEKLRRGFAEAAQPDGGRPARKGLGRMKASASRGSLGGTALATASGLGMGLAGLGLPDIPLLTAVLLRGIYRAGACYGFSWREPGEKLFALGVIRAALAPDAAERDAAFRALGEPAGELEEEIRRTAAVLSQALLLEKFIQGIPLVGAAGGLVNNRACSRVFRLAAIQYRKRYLRERLAALEG